MAKHCQPAFSWLEGSEVLIACDRALDHSLQGVYPMSCNVALAVELANRLWNSGRRSTTRVRVVEI